MSEPTPNLNLVVLRSADPARAVAFYERLGLQFERHRHGDGPEHLAAAAGSVVLEIYPRRDESDSTRSVRLGFRVAGLDRLLEELGRCGTPVVVPPRDSPWGRRAVVDDPDGHRVELVEA